MYNDLATPVEKFEQDKIGTPLSFREDKDLDESPVDSREISNAKPLKFQVKRVERPNFPDNVLKDLERMKQLMQSK